MCFGLNSWLHLWLPSDTQDMLASNFRISTQNVHQEELLQLCDVFLKVFHVGHLCRREVINVYCVGPWEHDQHFALSFNLPMKKPFWSSIINWDSAASQQGEGRFHGQRETWKITLQRGKMLVLRGLLALLLLKILAGVLRTVLQMSLLITTKEGF